MDTMLEQLRKTAEAHAKVYQTALDAERVNVEELPEVRYLHLSGKIGYHFPKGEALGYVWDGDTDTEPAEAKRSTLDGACNYNESDQAEYNNARALHHGADFTGRLDQNYVPVCELNQATRDELQAVIDGGGWKTLEYFSDYDGGWTECAGVGKLSESDTYRLRAPKPRPMTRKEVLAWAAGVQAFGWVVRIHGDLRLPSCLAYNADVAGYTRAPIATLNDDGTGGEWEAFEVAGDE